MYDKSAHDFCNEFYIVETTIEVVVKLQEESTTIRIDALWDERNKRYTTCAYRYESVTVQPTYPRKDEEFFREPENFQVWVDYELPDTVGNTADEVLRQALGFLGQRVSK